MRDIFYGYATIFGLDASKQNQLRDRICDALLNSKLQMVTGERFHFTASTVEATLNGSRTLRGKRDTRDANKLWVILGESLFGQWKPSTSDEMALLFVLIYLKDLYMADLTDWWCQGDVGLNIVLRGKPENVTRLIVDFFQTKRWNDS